MRLALDYNIKIIQYNTANILLLSANQIEVYGWMDLKVD